MTLSDDGEINRTKGSGFYNYSLPSSLLSIERTEREVKPSSGAREAQEDPHFFPEDLRVFFRRPRRSSSQVLI
ncbi:hypothetical protein OPV22_008448 [Ensete ventricosum]|uniref:Uncharacterized protein n=1 Tax=Ensete ventricosum TaxID=4639 RepID=A0AAV8R6M2_ENSVE|nr:hypothetical protein OPV22_008448 [Ensete ventricosum]